MKVLSLIYHSLNVIIRGWCFQFYRAGFRENMGTACVMLGKKSKYGAEEYG